MTTSTLKQIFDNSFNQLKIRFYQEDKIEENEQDTFPTTLAKKKMIDSLPPKIQIIEIIGPKNHKSLKNGKGFLIKYDFAKLNSNEVELCGSVSHKEPTKLLELIKTKFGIISEGLDNYVESLCEELNIIGYWNPADTWYLHFIADDIEKNPQVLTEEICSHFLFVDVPILQDKFRPEFYEDFNKIYNLQPDPIVDLAVLTQASHGSKAFSLNIENIQKSIADIKLIPSVPDNIQRAINMAKALHVYGYFKYEFFTIAQHYSYAALEGAIKSIYIKSFGSHVTLTDTKYEHLKIEMANPTYHKIERFCRDNNPWHTKRLLINDEPFQHSTKKIIQWLVDKKYIRKWEQQFYESSIEMRNNYSHFENVSISMPRPTIIQRNVEKINHLFHKGSQNS